MRFGPPAALPRASSWPVELGPASGSALRTRRRTSRNARSSLPSSGAARAGDSEALPALLDADVEFQVDTATASRLVRGAEAVAARAVMFARPDAALTPLTPLTPLTADGRPAVLVTVAGRPTSLMAFRVQARVVAIQSYPIRTCSRAWSLRGWRSEGHQPVTVLTFCAPISRTGGS